MCMYHLIPIASPDKAFCNNFMILKSTCFAVRLYWYWLSIFPISVMAESWCRLNQVVVPVTPRPIRLQTGGGGMEGIPMFTGQRDFLQDISIKSIYEWKIISNELHFKCWTYWQHSLREMPVKIMCVSNVIMLLLWCLIHSIYRDITMKLSGN